MPSPRQVRWAKIRSIAVTLTGLFILGTLVYLLGGNTFFQKKATVYLFVPDATGLDAASPVRVNGIGVGKVDSVELSGSSQPTRVVRVSMIIARDSLSLIPSDSTAQLSNDTLIGDKFIDIGKGTSPVPVQPNGEIAYQPQLDVLKSLDLEQFGKQMRELDVLISDIEQGRNRVGQFVRGDQFYKDLVRRVNQLDAGMRRAIASTGQVGRDVYTTTLYQRIKEPLDQFDLSLARIQSGQGPVGSLLKSDEQYESLRASVSSLTQTFKDLRSSTLISTDQVYTGVDQQIMSLIRSVDEFNAGPVFGPPSTYESLTGLAKELRNSVHDFRDDPRKYLRFKLF